jgi:hypothetical protein
VEAATVAPSTPAPVAAPGTVPAAPAAPTAAVSPFAAGKMVKVVDIAPADALVPSLRVLEALLAGENYTTGEDGLAAVRALVAADVSDEQQHRIVRLDEALPETLIFPWA